MKNIAIKVNNIGKEYILQPQNRYKTLRDTISSMPKKLFSKRTNENRLWALKNVSFEIKKGDALGVIGANGAGKSTLLKILARIITPTEGSAYIYGKMASMLEVGTGFNPELTGRENIFLNGSIIGMKKKEIENKFQDIVNFSEVEKFIDIPVKKYSSGMQIRLAFSIASHLDPEILLLDEILAVGDLAFQRKSLLKMHDIVKNQGRTVLLVSHNMNAIDTLCNKTLLLENGTVVAYGDTKDVISTYVKGVYKGITTDLKNKKRSGTGEVKIKKFWIEKENGIKVTAARSGEKCRFVFEYEKDKNISNKKVDFGFVIRTISGQPIVSNFSSYQKQEDTLIKKTGNVYFMFDGFPLAEGRYRLALYLNVDGKESDFIDDATEINVKAGDFFNVGFYPKQSFTATFVNGEWRYE